MSFFFEGKRITLNEMEGPSLRGEGCHHQRIRDMVGAVANCNKGLNPGGTRT